MYEMNNSCPQNTGDKSMDNGTCSLVQLEDTSFKNTVVLQLLEVPFRMIFLKNNSFSQFQCIGKFGTVLSVELVLKIILWQNNNCGPQFP